MRLATGRPVGPIVAVNGSNDASQWHSRLFYGFVYKKIIFQTPKYMTLNDLDGLFGVKFCFRAGLAG